MLAADLHACLLLKHANRVLASRRITWLHGIEIVQIENEKVSKGEEAAGPDAFDSNCITPGTPFMQRLGEHLRFFIRKKISEDPAWQVPVIVFSGLCSDTQNSSHTTFGVLQTALSWLCCCSVRVYGNAPL